MPSRKLFNQTLHLDRVKMRSLIKKKEAHFVFSWDSSMFFTLLHHIVFLKAL